MRRIWTVVFVSILAGCGAKETPATSEAGQKAPTASAKEGVSTAAPVVASRGEAKKPIGPPPEGVILPDEGDGGPAMLGVAAEILGEAHCGKDDLHMTPSPSLAVQTSEKKVYLIDQAAEKFADLFQDRRNHPSVRVKGVPYLKDGVLHLSAAEAEIVR